MNTFDQLITPLLTTFAHWLPPTYVVHIGATLPAIYQDLKNVPILLVDVDAAKKDQAQRQLPHIDLQFTPQLIAESTATVQWHQASNPVESGLVPPDQLRPYWQNLKTLATQTLSAISLDDALAAQQAQPSWLWVDCFPALALLRGAPITLTHANVVMARVIIDASNAPADTDLPALQNYMQQRGFVLAGVQPERHPAIGTAVFFRDFAKVAAEQLTALEAAVKAKDEQSKQLLAQTEQTQVATKKLAETQAEKAQLTLERDAEAKAKTQALAARDAEAKAKLEAIAERDAQTKRATERQVALEAAVQAKDEQSKQLLAQAEQAQVATKKLAETQAEKAQLMVERDAETKAKTQALAARDAETKAKINAIATRDAEAKAKTEALAARDAEAKGKLEAIAARDAQTKLATERTAQIKQLEQRASELHVQATENEQRQQMLQQELYRAEVQIDLIKDLLLREPGL